MLALRKIAITGGIASGKSSVCQFFKELGAFVVNADAIVHEILTPDTDLGKKVIHLLGLKYVSDDRLFRKIIAEKVFNNTTLLKSLEKILHPVVLKKIQELYAETSKKEKYTCFVVEMPLLFEIQAEEFYDITVSVLSDEAESRERLKMSGFQKEEYDRRMQRQMNPKQKSLKADYTLLNNGSLEDLKKQVVRLYQTLQNH